MRDVKKKNKSFTEMTMMKINFFKNSSSRFCSFLTKGTAPTVRAKIRAENDLLFWKQ